MLQRLQHTDTALLNSLPEKWRKCRRRACNILPMNAPQARTLPDDEEMWHAFIEGDRAYDGIFFTGVTSTGIFCRPSCSARKPKRENIRFFPAASEAMYAGFRACLRCRPMDRDASRPALVERLVALIEAAPSERIGERTLHEMGIDPSTARRQFQRYFGMSFQAYSRARRMGLALLAVSGPARRAQKTPVIHRQLEAGFQSASGFRDAFQRLFGTCPSDAVDVNVLYAEWLDSPLGPMLAIANDAGLHVLDFVDRRGLEREIGRLRKRTRAVVVPGAHPVIEVTRRELAEYFEGSRTRFSILLSPHGTDFQREVWHALGEIPLGQTTSYGALARKLGRPDSSRAVAHANGDNYRSIVVPCHRVLGADGALTGYGGGLARKQWLLDFERG